MIVIVAPADDFHAFVAEHLLVNTFGETCTVLELREFPRNAEYTLELGSGVTRGRCQSSRGLIDWSDVQSVWWRRAHLPPLVNDDPASQRYVVDDFARRESASLITSFFDEHLGRVVNRPRSQDLAGCKGTQLLHAQFLSIPIPETVITNSLAEIEAFRSQHGDCIYKILTKYDPELIPTRDLTDEDLRHHEGLRTSPIIVQRKLRAGQDIRVNIFGKEIYAASKPVRSVDGRFDFGLWSEHELPEELGTQLLELIESLGLEYGCIDLRLTDEGEYFFLELNPSGQFLMIERDTKQPLIECLCRLLLTEGTRR